MATSSGTARLTLPTDEEILITREFDAPKHLVYRAWTTPELVTRWWAGRRGQMKEVEIDLRVGGAWRYLMAASGGFELLFYGEFHEIVPNERLVQTELYEGPGSENIPAGAVPVNTVTFTEKDGRTTVELLTQTGSKELRDAMIDSGMEGGVQEQMDELERLAQSLR